MDISKAAQAAELTNAITVRERCINQVEQQIKHLQDLRAKYHDEITHLLEKIKQL